MADGLSARAANAARLAADKAAGRPVAYRPVPGSSSRYYNPLTREEVSGHYVKRIYNPTLSTPERYTVQQAELRRVRTERSQYGALYDTWITKQQSSGDPVTAANEDAKNREFNELYERFKIVSYNARNSPIEDPNRQDYFAADSEYAQLLVLLGRRRAEDTFPVGESSKQVGFQGSYIDEVVLPSLRR